MKVLITDWFFFLIMALCVILGFLMSLLNLRLREEGLVAWVYKK